MAHKCNRDKKKRDLGYLKKFHNVEWFHSNISKNKQN